jgi:hypothetical protein
VRIPAEACVRPWFAAIADAVTAGMISPDVSASIRRGIGEPTPVKATFGVDPDAHAVTGETLAAALPALIERCRVLDADRAWRVARDVRDELDAEGIRGRTEEAREQRFWRVHTRPSGMVGGSFLFDPEDGAIVNALFQNATHPKTKGKGRWVSEDELARRRQVAGDDRTTDQVAADALLTLLRAGAAAPGTGIPLAGNGLVRVIVTDETATQPHTDVEAHEVARTGFGAIDGTGIAVALEDVDRHLCEGSIDVIFDADGTPIDIGREQRLFSKRQRIGLITRDGGCRWPGCDQPGEYSEAHHIEHWVRDHGATEIRNGIMLCRRHHLLLHNHHWEIMRGQDDEFLLVPPRSVDANQAPVPMPSKARIRPDRQPVRLTG